MLRIDSEVFTHTEILCFILILSGCVGVCSMLFFYACMMLHMTTIPPAFAAIS